MTYSLRDRVGETYGTLTITAPSGWSDTKRRYRLWTFTCTCGASFVAGRHHVKSGKKVCNACKPNPFIEDLSGKVFGPITAVRVHSVTDYGHAIWIARCNDCGREGTCRAASLKERELCFCKRPGTTHGYSKTATYRAWRAMIGRCENPADVNYANYGGRGIKIDPAWRADFAQFLADMGPKPDRMELDRISVDGNYTAANCRWVTHKQNTRNKRNSIFITWGGKTMHINDWADHLGWSPNVLHLRWHRKWSIERMMTTPPRKP